jgi:hypothetical protein
MAVLLCFRSVVIHGYIETDLNNNEKDINIYYPADPSDPDLKLIMYEYICKRCNISYKTPGLSLNSYGEFLMRSIGGSFVYLDAISDPVFAELEELIREVCTSKKLNESQYSDLIQSLFGLTCDLDPEDNEYSIMNRPICPNCGFNEPSCWDEVYPYEFVDMNVPVVTHNHWEKLTKLEKLNLLRKAIDTSNFDKL